MQIRDTCLENDVFFYLNFAVKVYQLRILENNINSDLFSTSLILTISYLGTLQLFSLGRIHPVICLIQIFLKCGSNQFPLFFKEKSCS